jgi:hypothetical protein
MNHRDKNHRGGEARSNSLTWVTLWFTNMGNSLNLSLEKEFTGRKQTGSPTWVTFSETEIIKGQKHPRGAYGLEVEESGRAKTSVGGSLFQGN